MSDIPDILRKILARKIEEVTEREQQLPLSALGEQVAAAPAIRDFTAALRKYCVYRRLGLHSG